MSTIRDGIEARAAEIDRARVAQWPSTDRIVVLAVDPGYRESAWLSFDGGVIAHGIEANESLLTRFWKDSWSSAGFGRGPYEDRPTAVVFEQIESFGMAVGREVFETVFWTGRFYQAAGYITTQVHLMGRKAVKLHLCESNRATDSNISTALKDRFGGLAAVGVKKSPGPLYGIKSHEWAALALAVTFHGSIRAGRAQAARLR